MALWPAAHTTLTPAVPTAEGSLPATIPRGELRAYNVRGWSARTAGPVSPRPLTLVFAHGGNVGKGVCSPDHNADMAPRAQPASHGMRNFLESRPLDDSAGAMWGQGPEAREFTDGVSRLFKNGPGGMAPVFPFLPSSPLSPCLAFAMLLLTSSSALTPQLPPDGFSAPEPSLSPRAEAASVSRVLRA